MSEAPAENAKKDVKKKSLREILFEDVKGRIITWGVGVAFGLVVAFLAIVGDALVQRTVKLSATQLANHLEFVTKHKEEVAPTSLWEMKVECDKPHQLVSVTCLQFDNTTPNWTFQPNYVNQDGSPTFAYCMSTNAGRRLVGFAVCLKRTPAK